MRQLTIIYETMLDRDIIKVLEGVRVPGYTKFSGVSGLGKTGRHEGNQIWPGSNTIVIAMVPEEVVKDIVSKLEVVKSSYHKKVGLKVFAALTDELI
jgi:hypothetical protein